MAKPGWSDVEGTGMWLPLVTAEHVAGAVTIDDGCHLGGAVFGLLLLGNWVCGAVLLPASRRRPDLDKQEVLF